MAGGFTKCKWDNQCLIHSIFFSLFHYFASMGSLWYFWLRAIQVLRHQRGGWVGGVRKWQFLMIYSTVKHQRGGWVGLKKSKTWWRNIWMPPYLSPLLSDQSRFSNADQYFKIQILNLAGKSSKWFLSTTKFSSILLLTSWLTADL